MIRLVVGLGNPGYEYAKTRHNIGYIALDRYHEASRSTHPLPSFSLDKDLHAEVAKGKQFDHDVILLKPHTFMNESGRAVQAVKHYYKIDNKDMLVVHDDADIKFGLLNVVSGGSGGGHKGVESIINTIGEDFFRLKIGVSNQFRIPGQAIEFVLKAFSPNEWSAIPSLTEASSREIERFVRGDRTHRRLYWQ